MNTRCKVSVIIPVTREKKAQEAIRAVEKQGYPKKFLEIIAVDIKKKLSPGKRRNLGAKRAKGEILLFLDDDCLPQKGWLKENIKALKDKSIGAVSGMVLGKSRSFFARCVDFTNFDRAQIPKRKEGVLFSATLGTKKVLWEKVGGFDETLLAHEDIDFCCRLIQLGYKTVYEPRIKVWHHHGRETFGAFLRYLYNGGKNGGLTIEKRYPNLLPYNKIVTKLAHPWFYFWFIVPFAMVSTIQTFFALFPYYPGVIFYLFFVFLGRLACQVGIWRSTFSKSL